MPGSERSPIAGGGLDVNPIREGPDRERSAAVWELLEEIATIDLIGIESNDDEHDILADIIERAREIVPPSEACGECTAKAWTLVLCPDGAEICRNCVEQGLH